MPEILRKPPYVAAGRTFWTLRAANGCWSVPQLAWWPAPTSTSGAELACGKMWEMNHYVTMYGDLVGCWICITYSRKHIYIYTNNVEIYIYIRSWSFWVLYTYKKLLLYKTIYIYIYTSVQWLGGSDSEPGVCIVPIEFPNHIDWRCGFGRFLKHPWWRKYYRSIMG